MDVSYFFTERTAFIRRFYEVSAAPFREIIRQIEEEEHPYEPPYSEDGEPAFMAEWMAAQTSLDLLGLTCISMLSESLKLYFATWKSEMNAAWPIGEEAKRAFKEGYLTGYKYCFGMLLDIDWSTCPAKFDIIEQVVLARNRAQHPEHITNMDVRHSERDRAKYPKPFFIGDREKALIEAKTITEITLLGSNLTVTEGSLHEAIETVETLVKWIETRITDKYF